MRCFLLLCLLFWPLQAFGEVDAALIHKIVMSELSALKMPLDSPFCLAILPSKNTSSTGADPSPHLLAFLSKRGMHPKKASVCYKALRGNVIAIDLAPEADGQLRAKVAFSDVTIPPGEDLGTLIRRGVYHFIKNRHGEWIIMSYTAEIPEPSTKPGAARQ